jgi:hypothetical protein
MVLQRTVVNTALKLSASTKFGEFLIDANTKFVRFLFHTVGVIKTKLHGLSPRAIYTDRATAACRRSDCQLVRIEGATWSA